MFTPVRPKPVASTAESSQSLRMLLPKADIYESEDAFMLIVDLPGVSEQDINVNVDNNTLTIEAKASKEDLEGFELVYTEFAVANYKRQFHISDAIETDSISADLKDGTLRLTLPKHAVHKPRTIKVQSV